MYGTIDITTWNDRKFRALSAPPPCAQVLWLYLLAPADRIVIPGLLPAGEATIAEKLRWPIDATRAAFAEILAQGMAETDPSGPLIWLPNALRYAPRPNPNIVEGWGKKGWASVPECALKHKAWRAMREDMRARGDGFLAAFDRGFPEPSSEQVGAPVPPNHRRKVARKVTAKVQGEGSPPTSTGTTPLNTGGEQEQEQEQKRLAGLSAQAREQPASDPATPAVDCRADLVGFSGVPVDAPGFSDATQPAGPPEPPRGAGEGGKSTDSAEEHRRSPVAEPTAAQGIARPMRAATPRFDDDLPRRPLVIQDNAVPGALGTLGTEFRTGFEEGLGHGVVIAKAGEEQRVATALEALLAVIGMARALEICLETAMLRRRVPGGDPGALAWCLQVLEPHRHARPAPEARPAGCPEFARLRAAFRGKVLPRIYERWFADLDGLRVGDELEIYAPDQGHRDFLVEHHLAWMQDLANECPDPLQLRIEVREQPPLAAAGGA
jgi:hypothetical protein